MGIRDAHHGSRPVFWLPVLLVLAILAAGGTTYWLDRDDAPGADTPAAVPPPAGIELPTLQTPAVVAEAATGSATPGRVRRALEPLLEDADLGPHVLATVAGLDGTLLYSGGTGEAVPASTLKLLTATAALETLGPDHRFATTVVSAGARQVVLVGGGDPLLDAHDIKALARQAAARLPAAARVRVGYDTSLFSGPDVSPRWPATYISEGVVSPIQALWVDEGRAANGYSRVADPATVAADLFASALAMAGVTVVGRATRGPAPAGATELARLESDPLDRIVEHTLETSDNEAAEVLARQVGLAATGIGSFQAGTAAALDVLDDLGVPVDDARLLDGSGLSRDDRIDPDTITGVLEVASSDEHPELRAVVTGLPVAGFTGSLTGRFVDAGDRLGRGLVRAKTGTLTGVSSLAGIVVDRTGTPMVFALMADRIDVVDTLGARAALDAATSALAACRCGSPGTVGP